MTCVAIGTGKFVEFLSGHRDEEKKKKKWSIVSKVRETSLIRLSLLLKTGRSYGNNAPDMWNILYFEMTENGYTVLNWRSNEEEEVTCVGVFLIIRRRKSGVDWRNIRYILLYGPQLQVEQYELQAPEDSCRWNDIWEAERSKESEQPGSADCAEVQRGYVPHY